MTTDFERAKTLFEGNNYTCVLCKGEQIYTSTERGVKPLLELLDGAENLNGFSAADKIVGKAAAMLYVLLGVKEVYAEVLSRAGAEVFANYKIACEYGELTGQIINRNGDGICPMEKAVQEIDDPVLGLKAIKNKLALLSRTK